MPIPNDNGHSAARAARTGLITAGDAPNRRWRRRVITIPAVTVAWVLATAAAPAALLLAALADLTSTPRLWARCRTLIALWWLLACEVGGLAGAFLVWLVHLWRRDEHAYRGANATLQRIWSEALFRGAARVFRLKLTVEGEAASAAAPYLLFVRHSSVLDTLLAATLIANPQRILFRYVIKQELLWNPCLDVVGCRLPNAFVARGRSSRHEQVAAVRQLAHSLGPSEGVLIYPEGTRFSASKLERAIERLEDQAPPGICERARRLRHVLPPRSGGPLALMREAPDLDVVFLTHSGLEAAATLGDLWRGALVGVTIHTQIRRVAAADIPHDSAQLLPWLYDQWLESDQWIDDVRARAHAREAGSRETR
jgi:1-acyl-sn-glycerol-3-phosphate acyltransferase